MRKNTQHIRGKSGLKTLRPARGSLPQWARNSNTWPSPSGEDGYKEGVASQRPGAREEEEELSQKTGSLGAQESAVSSSTGGNGDRAAGSSGAVATDPGKSSPDRALPRRWEGARAEGRCRARAVAVDAARSTSRPPARGRLALPAPPPLPRGARAQAASDPSCHSTLLLFRLPVWHGIICAESC